MNASPRNILIRVRNQQTSARDSHVHEKAKAHLKEHAIAHETKKLTEAVKLLRPASPKKSQVVPKKHSPEKSSAHNILREVTPEAVTQVEPMVTSRVLIPKKPFIIEGISMSSLQIAYFCMELGVENTFPTYAGGLGILAGDMLRSCADLNQNVIGISLVYHKGYFRQRIDESGWQHEEDASWNPYEKLILLPHQVTVEIEGRSVAVRAWLYRLTGIEGNINPVIFLDTDVETNTKEDREITDRLYSGDQRLRLYQEAVLGIGGMRMLSQLGATNIQKFHMNEGHAALLTLELYRTYALCDNPLEEVRSRAVFTTHTPVAAGHDRFPRGLFESIIDLEKIPLPLIELLFENGELNMTALGLRFSRYVNGVAKKHGVVSRELFPGYHIETITNGVSATTWTSDACARLYDKYLPTWRSDPYSLRYALSIPPEELWRAHEEAKRVLITYINQKYQRQFRTDLFTIGFARRATAYKRGDLLFSDVERLKKIAQHSRGIQIIYAGKAHPHDHEGKMLIQRIIGRMKELGGHVECVYLSDYDMELAKLLVSGVDVWLNTPVRPQEASGTSGMKAALNGVLHFSILDGWWLEGHIEGVTGWSIGPHPERVPAVDVNAQDVEDLYTKLEYVILPRFENERDQWIRMMRQAIAINGSFFNTHRMVEQYVLGAYFK